MINHFFTKEDLIKLFRSLGIKEGMILEVHSSLKAFQYIVGGAQTFNDALIETLGYNGTILMPLQNAHNSDPAYFTQPAIDHSLHQKYRDNMPAFDHEKTDSAYMGRAVENLRRRKKALFTEHPNCAFVAYGKYAKVLCAHQELSFALSDTSPLGRLYELKAYCLLAGVDYDKMTSLHLSEYRSEIRPVILQGAKVKKGDEEVWKKYLEIDLDSDDGFKEIGQRLEKNRLVSMAALPKGMLKLVRVDVAVDEGAKYFEERLKAYH